jgi:hypothetical protein
MNLDPMNNVESKLPIKQPCMSRRAKKWNYTPFQVVCCVGTVVRQFEIGRFAFAAISDLGYNA